MPPRFDALSALGTLTQKSARLLRLAETSLQPNRIGKEVRTIPKEILEQRIAEAWALIRKGGLSAKIGRAFLNQHAVL